MPPPDEEQYHELCAYTLSRGDAAFIHQHVVDAWAAQHADEATKPITLAFALVGLYLHVVEGRSGREVQRAHMALAREKRPWPRFELPRERGDVTVADVMAEPPGPARDAALDRWCASVWSAYAVHTRAVAGLLRGRN